MGQVGSYYESMGSIGPGIDISHYGAPYKGMLGTGDGLGAYVSDPGMGMLYRYGMGGWEGKPSEDPRMVKKYTRVRATYGVRGVPSDRAEEAGQRLHYQGRQLFSGNTVRKLGSTGWIAGGKVGYEIILANPMRAGEIKRKIFQAGVRAGRGMGEGASFTNARVNIPQDAFMDAPTTAPSTPEETPAATPAEEAAAAEGSFLTQKVGGLPVWAVGLIGIGVVGGVAAIAMKGKKKAPTPNRRRRRRRRRRRTTRRRR